MIRQILMFMGVAAILLLMFLVYRLEPLYYQYRQLDEKALPVFTELALNVLKTGSVVEATVWKRKVAPGVSAEDAEIAMRSVANEYNIKNVGELPLYKEVEAMSGQPYRFMKIYMFCNALTAAKMADYSDAFSAYLPCRVALLEDRKGALWIVSLNMDLMIYGGKPLPAALKQEAMQVKKIILDIMNRGAAGEF